MNRGMTFRIIAWLATLGLVMAEQEYFSCKDLKEMNPSLRSGLYTILLPCGEHEVYCEMSINGGGYTFISSNLLPQLAKDDLIYLTKNQDDVLLRISRPDSTQPYTVLTPYRANTTFSIGANDQGKFIHNSPLGPHIRLNTLPGSLQKGDDITVFLSNGQPVSYHVCPPGWKVSGNHFVFYTNPGEVKPSTYHSNNLVYERVGVAVDWRKTARRPYSGRRIPLDYFLFTEVYYGGCGCYTSSDRWLHPTSTSPALATAIGLR